MIHHGAASPNRRLENMIEMMRYLDRRFVLDMILVPGDRSYIAHLRNLARDLPSVRFLPAVPMPQIPEFVNHYDVGVAAIAPTTFNTKHSLPNKFFEYIQGRLAIVIGPSPEMAKIIREYGCGVVADGFRPRDLANAVMSLDSQRIYAMKMNADRAARHHCAENNLQKLQESLVGGTKYRDGKWKRRSWPSTRADIVPQ